MGSRKLYDNAVEFCNTKMSERSALKDRAALMKQHAFETFERVQGALHRFELTYNIATRWTPDMQEWKAAANYHSTRAYQKALSKLEGLVVARLFELHKMGLSGTGKFFNS
jgi:TPP-dependent trihydroxycyclohexane-1,2-dione (THcHDO) dehydratase